jgi:hypothetical protein
MKAHQNPLTPGKRDSFTRSQAGIQAQSRVGGDIFYEFMSALKRVMPGFPPARE